MNDSRVIYRYSSKSDRIFFGSLKESWRVAWLTNGAYNVLTMIDQILLF